MSWKRTAFYAAVIYAFFICSGLYLAHGKETSKPLPSSPAATAPAQPKDTPQQQYVVPRIASTDALQRIRESKPCREYLSICERSCKDRGEMFKFACIGQDFQPFEDHSRCICSDDFYARKQVSRQEIQVQREGKE